jgi:4'-phosphopantetheinyl transferase
VRRGGRPGAVLVWFIPLTPPPAAAGVLAGLLDEGEQDRAGRFGSPDDRRRFVVCRGVARLVLGRMLGTPPSRLRWAAGPHGKPELAGDRGGLRFSLAHSGDLGLLAVAAGRPIGVDVELRRDADYGRLARRFLDPAGAAAVTAAGGAGDAAFLRLWTRKEAVVKAAGGRLAQGLALPVSGTSPLVVRDPRGVLPGRWLVRDLPAAGGYAAAIAAAGARPYDVISRRWAHAGVPASARPRR